MHYANLVLSIVGSV